MVDSKLVLLLIASLMLSTMKMTVAQTTDAATETTVETTSGGGGETNAPVSTVGTTSGGGGETNAPYTGPTTTSGPTQTPPEGTTTEPTTTIPPPPPTIKLKLTYNSSGEYNETAFKTIIADILTTNCKGGKCEKTKFNGGVTTVAITPDQIEIKNVTSSGNDVDVEFTVNSITIDMVAVGQVIATNKDAIGTSIGAQVEVISAPQPPPTNAPPSVTTTTKAGTTDPLPIILGVVISLIVIAIIIGIILFYRKRKQSRSRQQLPVTYSKRNTDSAIDARPSSQAYSNPSYTK